jgi:hypothetical protein
MPSTIFPPDINIWSNICHRSEVGLIRWQGEHNSILKTNSRHAGRAKKRNRSRREKRGKLLYWGAHHRPAIDHRRCAVTNGEIAQECLGSSNW